MKTAASGGLWAGVQGGNHGRRAAKRSLPWSDTRTRRAEGTGPRAVGRNEIERGSLGLPRSPVRRPNTRSAVRCGWAWRSKASGKNSASSERAALSGSLSASNRTPKRNPSWRFPRPTEKCRSRSPDSEPRVRPKPGPVLPYAHGNTLPTGWRRPPFRGLRLLRRGKSRGPWTTGPRYLALQHPNVRP
jgi:hypothetical protein